MNRLAIWTRPATARLPALLLGLGIAAGPAPGAAEAPGAERDWPGWRGRGMDLSVPAAGVFEPGHSYRLDVVWKKELGSGYSAISVVDGIAVTLFAGERAEYAAAFDAESGEELWRAEIGPRFPGHYGSQDGPISTPLIAEGRVFALDPGGVFYAFDLETGERLWSVDLPREQGVEQPFYGFATSPVYFDGSVIVLTGGQEGPAVTAFAAASGEVVWTAGSDSIRYQSPLLVTADGGPQLLVIGDRQLMGIDPAGGELRWTMEHGGDQRDIGGASAYIVKASGDRYFLKNKADGSVLVELADGREGAPAEQLWESRHIKNTYVPAVYHGGYFYGYNTRILSCVDAATGEVVWKSRPPGDGFPILLDGHLVIVTKGGTLSIAPASPDGYQEIASLELFDDLVWTPASFANGSLFLRSLSEWARVDIVEDDQQVRVARETGGVISDSEFARFVAGLDAAEDKAAVIEQFMKAQEQFPIIEGKEMVHFVYRGPGDDLALVSDLFGGRTDRPMHRVPGTDLFYYSARLEPDARIDYSFLRDFEEEIEPDPLNPRQTLYWRDRYGSFVAMPDWVEPTHFAEPKEGARGRLEELVLESPHLEENLTLQVYLPPGYEPGGERYPVAYVLAGDDAIHIGQLTHTLDNLIGESVAPVIVVFVPFFGQGYYQTYVGAGKDEHVRVLVEEIVPLVDRTYPTVASVESRAMIGHWFTAYASVYATFKHPGVFGKLGLQSVRWEPGYEAENRELIADPGRQPLEIYLDWGTYDWRSPMEGLNGPEMGRVFARTLREKGYAFTGGEVHDSGGWSSWRNRTDRVLETLFPLQ